MNPLIQWNWIEGQLFLLVEFRAYESVFQTALWSKLAFKFFFLLCCQNKAKLFKSKRNNERFLNLNNNYQRIFNAVCFTAEEYVPWAFSYSLQYRTRFGTRNILFALEESNALNFLYHSQTSLWSALSHHFEEALSSEIRSWNPFYVWAMKLPRSPN